jgi:5-methylcytosine-specific restriction endonuclease McrA
MNSKSGKTDKLDKVVAEARRRSEERGHSYRAQALKLFPWVCGRCGREFNRTNLHELTVHHRDHNHDNNPEDGSNWELLCLYCHDNEHARYVGLTDNFRIRTPGRENPVSTCKPFAELGNMLKRKKT